VFSSAAENVQFSGKSGGSEFQTVGSRGDQKTASKRAVANTWDRQL